MRVDVTIDDVPRTFETDGLRTLSDLLRVEFAVQSYGPDCTDGSCGACAVLVDDELACACLVPLVHVDGRRVTTIHGLGAEDARMHRAVERSFARCDVAPCEICFPATILFMVDLQRRSRTRSSVAERDVREALGGIGCRCGIHAAAVGALTDAVNECLAGERAR